MLTSFIALLHPSGVIGTGIVGDFCYMLVRTYQEKFYTAVFLLLKDVMLRLFSIRKHG